MAQTSIGFNGSISAAQWAAKAPLLLDGSDAVGTPTDLRVTSPTGIRAVDVAAGDIGGDGIVTNLSSSERIMLPTPTNGQWFLLVMNRVWSTGATSLLLRNGATTSATFGFLPPSSFPASTTTNPGTNSDVPIAWLWANSSSTNVWIFPLLLPTVNAYPRVGTSTQRSTVLQSIQAPAPWNSYYAQMFWPLWLLDNNEYQQFVGPYDATNNPNGRASGGWLPVGMQSNPIRYASETGANNGGNALHAYGKGGMAYADGTQGLYYLRADGRLVRLDSDTFVIVDAISTVSSSTGASTIGGSVIRYSSSNTEVFPTRSDGVVGPIAVPGWYYVTASVQWQTTNTSSETFIEVTQNDTAGGIGNNTPPISDRRAAVNSSHQATVSGYLPLSAGDFVKLKAWQNSGASRNVISRLSVRLARPDNV